VIPDLPFVVPENATFRETEALFGLPSAITRRLIAQGHIRAVQVYQRTLIDLASLRAYLSGLPSAVVAPSGQNTAGDDDEGGDQTTRPGRVGTGARAPPAA
jgi:hypothetical protein